MCGNASCLASQVFSCICPFYQHRRSHCPVRLGNLRRLLLFQKVVLLSVIYQSYFSQKFNNNRNLTAILSFSLFKHSWSASFSHLLLRSAPKQQMVCLYAAAGFIPLHPLFLSRDSVCASVCVWTFTASSCHSVLSASPSQKAGELGVHSSYKPRCPAVIQFPFQSPCRSIFIHNPK